MTASPPSPAASSLDLEALDRLADDAHRGQTRSHGTPYIEHPRAVQRLAEDLAHALGLDEAARIEAAATALLHDVLEDSPVTEAALAERASPSVAARVGCLTKEPLAEKGRAPSKAVRDERYWARLAAEGDDLARLVKVADRVHNLFELPLTGDRLKATRKLEETRRHIRPLAAAARDPRVATGLVAVVDDAVRLCEAEVGLVRPAPAAHPRGLYALVNAGPHDDEATLLRRADDALAGGAQIVQLRAKALPDRTVLALATALVERVGDRAWFVLNDRADLALAAGAHGLHVGTGDLPPAACRRVLGSRALLGASSHTPAELAAQTEAGHLDYVAYGPVFASRTKQGHADVVGLNGLAAACASSSRPVCAIGGVDDPARAAACARAGARLVAVVSALERADDPRLLARRLHVSFLAAHGAPGRP